MRRILLAAFVLASLVALPSPPAQAAISADINVHLGRTYPVEYRRAPRGYFVPSTEVYYVPDQDYDMYRYGHRWYINDSGSWFCAQSYRGPFVRVAFERVPRMILQVPGRYHRQDRGYWQQDRSWQTDGSRGDYRNDGNGRWSRTDRGRGHGKGNGHWNRDDQGRGNGRGREGDDD